MENLIYRFIYSKEKLCGDSVPEWLPGMGMIGYTAGYIGFFAYLRLCGSVFPGIFSCLLLIIMMLASEMLGVAIIHLFISFSGKKGNAATLFYLFGCSCFLFTLFIPAGLLARISHSVAAWFFLALYVAIFVSRVKMLRRTYSQISIGKSVLVIFIPGILLQGMLYLFMVYGIVNGIWLVRMSV